MREGERERERESERERDGRSGLVVLTAGQHRLAVYLCMRTSRGLGSIVVVVVVVVVVVLIVIVAVAVVDAYIVYSGSHASPIRRSHTSSLMGHIHRLSWAL